MDSSNAEAHFDDRTRRDSEPVRHDRHRLAVGRLPKRQHGPGALPRPTLSPAPFGSFWGNRGITGLANRSFWLFLVIIRLAFYITFDYE